MNEENDGRRGTSLVAEPSDLAARRIEQLRPFRWRKGETGNPFGRVGALARRIRHATKQGQDLVAFLVGVIHEKHAWVDAKGRERRRRESTKDKLSAVAMLYERGWGRPLQASLIEHRLDGGNRVAASREAEQLRTMLNSLSTAELEELHRLSQRLWAIQSESIPSTATPVAGAHGEDDER